MRGLIRVAMLALVIAALSGAAGAQGLFPQSVASGDPTPDSVVLWTRVDSPEMPDALQVEVATDETFANVVFTRQLTASADNDWCLKVLVDGLEAYTTYYYRFVYGTGAAMEYSPVGRTRTAPTADMDVPVRFAVVYCQDYIGRYYNAYLKMLLDHDEDIDFVVHLGDYIYETTGDLSFQDPTDDRKIEFDDVDGAIQLGDDENPSYAAASLDNYRQIYRTYRDDEVLQEVHERWPMLVIWDDHEYSNDAWGATATYTNGREDEYDVARKQNSEQAFFEWVPIAAGLGDDGVLDIGADDLYPNAMIYRDLIYGSNLHLVLTDLRSFRPDHLVPEDGFPGTIVVEEETLAGMIGEAWPAVRGSFDPYVDMTVLGGQLKIFQQTLSIIAANLYMMENPELDFFSAVRLGEAAMSGNVSANFINLMFEATGNPGPFPPEFLAVLPRGISYLVMGKTSIYSSAGSRLQVIKDTFDLFAAARYLETAGAAQEAYGSTQNAWLQGTLLASPAKWKVLGNSFIMTPMVIDFTNPFISAILPPSFPDVLRTRLLVNAEDFNGLPQKRAELIGNADTAGLLDLVPNSVVFSGDIHATFVTDHGDSVFEFTPPAISSATNAELVMRFILADPILGQIPGIEELLSNYGLLLQVSAMDPTVSLSNIWYQNTWSHGYAIADVTPDAFTVTLQEISSDEISTSYYDDPEALNDLFTPLMMTIRDGVLAPGP